MTDRDYAGLVQDLLDFSNPSYYATGTTFFEYPIAVRAADAIEELLAKVPQWISVEDELPEPYRVVLVVKDHPVDYLHGYEFATRYTNGEWSGCNRKVLFWMPLPEPPKGVE